MSITSFLGLIIPDKNSKGRVVTDVFEPNFTKIDQNAEKLKTDIDKKLDKGNYDGTAENLHADDNAIWGGEYGGYIQDTSITKVIGKRYIDQFDGKAYECLVPSHENTITNYQACNVKDNLSKINELQCLFIIPPNEIFSIDVRVYDLLIITFEINESMKSITIDCKMSSNRVYREKWYFGSESREVTAKVDTNGKLTITPGMTYTFANCYGMKKI